MNKFTGRRQRASRGKSAAIAASCFLALFGPSAGIPLQHNAARAAPAVFTVTTTVDTSSCPTALSLRCAITEANASDSGAAITFAIPAADPGCSGSPAVCVISPLSPLPPLTSRGVAIDGGTQAGAARGHTEASSGDSATLAIRLDGARAGAPSPGLLLRGENDAIRGLAITSFAGPGISITTGAAGDCSIQGNFVGVAPDGTPAGNGGGILVNNGAGNERIGGTAIGDGNLISNNGFGIRIAGGGMNTITGNVVGTNPNTSAAQPNRGAGISLAGTSGNTIGGIGPAEGNLVAGNRGPGLSFTQTGGTVVEGNLIGLNQAGEALPNAGNGIVITEASNNEIGGRVAGAGNTISGNHKYGIEMQSSGINQVQGNRLGTDVAGTRSVPNGGGGIALISTSTTTVGGPLQSERNIISGNRGTGIALRSAGGNTIEGNFIGANAGGLSSLGNGGDGILFTSLDHDRILRNVIVANGHSGVEIRGAGNDLIQGNRIGVGIRGRSLGNRGNGVYLHAGSTGDTVIGNIVAANRRAGVMIGDSRTDQTRERVSRNAIFANRGLGIDLWPAGKINCSSPSPTAPDGYTPCPKLERASRTSVAGLACPGCLVEVFVAARDRSGHGQGERYLGTARATRYGHWRVGIGKRKVRQGAWLTATATRRAYGNWETSEFSADRRT